MLLKNNFVECSIILVNSSHPLDIFAVVLASDFVPQTSLAVAMNEKTLPSIFLSGFIFF
jgi:hypothetical protein